MRVVIAGLSDTRPATLVSEGYTSENFKVRDERKAGHHWADNEVLDDFGPKIGPVGYAIYMFLARHAGNRSGKCTRSQQEIASAFGISRDTVNRHIPILVDTGLVVVIESAGQPSEYILAEIEKYTPAAKSDRVAAKSDTYLPQNLTHLPQNLTHNKEAKLVSKLNHETNPKQLGGAAALGSQDWKIGITKEMAGKAIMEELLINDPFALTLCINAVGSFTRHNTDLFPVDAKESICALWKEYSSSNIHAKSSFRTWIGESDNFLRPERWRKEPKDKKPKYEVDHLGGHFEDGGKVYVNASGRRLPGYRPPPPDNPSAEKDRV